MQIRQFVSNNIYETLKVQNPLNARVTTALTSVYVFGSSDVQPPTTVLTFTDPVQASLEDNTENSDYTQSAPDKVLRSPHLMVLSDAINLIYLFSNLYTLCKHCNILKEKGIVN